MSGREDLNLRPFGPEPNALPDCATPRCFARSRSWPGRTPAHLPPPPRSGKLARPVDLATRKRPQPGQGGSSVSSSFRATPWSRSSSETGRLIRKAPSSQLPKSASLQRCEQNGRKGALAASEGTGRLHVGQRPALVTVVNLARRMSPIMPATCYGCGGEASCPLLHPPGRRRL